MRIETGRRRVAIGVGELARFTSPSRMDSGASLQWRLAAGVQAHKALRDERAFESSAIQFEVPVAAELVCNGWQFDLQGRIDVVRTEQSHVELIEFKTVSARLPIEATEFKALYPHHLVQTSLYRLIFEAMNHSQLPELRTTLMLESINDGFRQLVPVDQDDARRWFEWASESIVPMLEQRRNRECALERLPEIKPFPSPRDGQDKAISDLNDASLRSSFICFEAPTGFGKTAVILAHALNRLRETPLTRIIYLSSKATGQNQVFEALQAMLPADGFPAVSGFQLRNKAEHAKACRALGCDAFHSCQRSACDQSSRLWELGLQMANGSRPTFNATADAAARAQICPFALSMQRLDFANLWVCDYNYVFAPGVRSLLDSIPSFKPSETLLIADEAHNLPSRVAECLSFTASAHETSDLADELQLLNTDRRLQKAVREWAAFIRQLKTSDKHPFSVQYNAEELLQEFDLCVRQHPVNLEHITQSSLAQILNTPRALSMIQSGRDALLWSPTDGSLRLTCLDASDTIADTVSSFGSTIMLSATFGPRSAFESACGLVSNNTAWVQAPTPWRDSAFRTAVDTRVDTRLRFRHIAYATTAQTVVTMAARDTTVVFFPSYQYAETVAAYVASEAPWLIVKIQPRATDLHGQMLFVETSLLTAHALFFVLGSSFSESIDHLGGRVSQAIVVSPSLPEANAVQNAKLERNSEHGREQAFIRTYLTPAFQRIHQALGRLVRAPDQRATIVLHCKRFAKSTYLNQLRPEYLPKTVIRSSEDLELFINDGCDFA